MERTIIHVDGIMGKLARSPRISQDHPESPKAFLFGQTRPMIIWPIKIATLLITTINKSVSGGVKFLERNK